MDVEKKTKKLCRVCLEPAEKKCPSVFKEYKNIVISEQINSLTNVEISKGDGLPRRICFTCLLDLETAINFKQRCENSNIILQTKKLKKFTESNVNLELSFPELVVIKEETREESDCLDIDFVDANDSPDNDDKKPSLDKGELGLCKSKANVLHVQCDDCGELFKSKCKLRVHWKRMHLHQTLICKKCKRTFRSAKSYQNHRKRNYESCSVVSLANIEGEGKERIFHCRQCDYKTIRTKDMRSHLITHSGIRPYVCEICSSTFTQQCSMQDHMEIVHKHFRVEITCQYCGKYVRGRRYVYRHLAQHKNICVQCDICKKTYKNRKILKIHMRRHSGVKSYTCEQCASSFYSSSELANHRRNIHEKGQHWYNCDQCEYKNTKNGVVKRHKLRHTGTNFPCTVCGSFFLTMQKLILHQRRHFVEKSHVCLQCNQRFLRKDSLLKHMKTKHSLLNCSKTPVNVKEENPVVKVLDGVLEIEVAAPKTVI